MITHHAGGAPLRIPHAAFGIDDGPVRLPVRIGQRGEHARRPAVRALGVVIAAPQRRPYRIAEIHCGAVRAETDRIGDDDRRQIQFTQAMAHRKLVVAAERCARRVLAHGAEHQIAGAIGAAVIAARVRDIGLHIGQPFQRGRGGIAVAVDIQPLQ
ncbi:hypothetical protein D3C71_1431330 [compost metagenome]